MRLVFVWRRNRRGERQGITNQVAGEFEERIGVWRIDVYSVLDAVAVGLGHERVHSLHCAYVSAVVLYCVIRDCEFTLDAFRCARRSHIAHRRIIVNGTQLGVGAMVIVCHGVQGYWSEHLVGHLHNIQCLGLYHVVGVVAGCDDVSARRHGVDRERCGVCRRSRVCLVGACGVRLPCYLGWRGAPVSEFKRSLCGEHNLVHAVRSNADRCRCGRTV